MTPTRSTPPDSSHPTVVIYGQIMNALCLKSIAYSTDRGVFTFTLHVSLGTFEAFFTGYLANTRDALRIETVHAACVNDLAVCSAALLASESLVINAILSLSAE